MRVVMQCGSRAGEVMDFLPHEARAMLADGRARPVSDAEPIAPVVGVPTRDRMAAPVVRETKRRR